MDLLKREDVEKVIQRFRINVLKNLIQKDDEFWSTIVGLKFSILCDPKTKIKTFRCVYRHQTDNFNIDDYDYRDDDEFERKNEPISKSTILEFGYYNESYYVTGVTDIKVYTKKDLPDIPFTLNNKYEARLDDYEQSELLNKYTENKNIPEWFLISFFKALKLEKIKISELLNQLCFE